MPLRPCRTSSRLAVSAAPSRRRREHDEDLDLTMILDACGLVRRLRDPVVAEDDRDRRVDFDVVAVAPADQLDGDRLRRSVQRELTYRLHRGLLQVVG